VTSANLVGTVIDATDAAVPNATVTATNTATGVKLTTATTLDGAYRMSNLPVGTYDVNVTASGFSPATQSGIVLQLNLTGTLNFKLEVGAVTTSINVEAVTAIDTTTAQVQNTFQTKAIADLPVATVGLGVLNLSLLGSGVSSNGGMGAGTGPAVGGQRPRNNNFTVAGIDNNDKSITGPLVSIPNDAVAEFSVLQNQFAAEYGHSSGGQFNTIVRSGPAGGSKLGEKEKLS
jgi:Carboxypeptidase regulatory-like domain